MATVADKCRLVSNRLEIDLFPRTTHFCKLLLICEDGIQCLGDLVDIEESHFEGEGDESSKGEPGHKA